MAVDEASGFVFWSEWLAASPVIHFSDIQQRTDGSYPDITQQGNAECAHNCTLSGANAIEKSVNGYERWSLENTIWRGTLSGSEIWPIITEGRIQRFFPIDSDGDVVPKPHPAWAYWPKQVVIQNPGTVEVDTSEKRVYWAEMPIDPPHWISSSTYDGTARALNLYACDMGTGITSGRFRVDVVNKKIYFVDSVSPYWYIMKANYDGSSREMVSKFEFSIMSFVLDLDSDLVYFASSGTTKHPSGIYKTGISGRRRSTPKYGACHRDNVEDDCEYLLRIPEGKIAQQTYEGQPVDSDKAYRPRDLVLDKKQHAIHWTGYMHVDTYPTKNYRTCINNHEPRKPESFSSSEAEIYGDMTPLYSSTAMTEIDLLDSAVDSTSSMPACSSTPATSTTCVDEFEICPDVASREEDSSTSASANCGQKVYAVSCCASCSSKPKQTEAGDDDATPPTCPNLKEEDGKWLPKSMTLSELSQLQTKTSDVMPSSQTTTEAASPSPSSSLQEDAPSPSPASAPSPSKDVPTPSSSGSQSPSRVVGSLGLTVSNVSAILDNSAAKVAFEDAMAGVIADAAGVTKSDVSVTVSAASDGSRRLLSGGLSVAYTINVQASAESASVISQINMKSSAELETMVSEALATADLAGTVTISSVSHESQAAATAVSDNKSSRSSRTMKLSLLAFGIALPSQAWIH
eukprot:TRINITY_DN92066_c0_g1_i1.p1 TRINITY_DN92066_c0_g1~~TRINITY_DN92066_c0_g1_i1.p1  ORF type:complete len:791 (+),score=121.96 TRINITY_DN92066_c0_g1_i1:314-2374(+)